MAKGLKTPNPLIKPTVGELEQKASRLAVELGITLSETSISGSTYETEVSGENKGISLSYFREFDGYECIEAEKEEGSVNISNVKGSYSITLKNYGKNLLAARKPHNTKVEEQLFVAIMGMLITIKKRPEEQHEVCVGINEEDLKTISHKTIEKYLP